LLLLTSCLVYLSYEIFILSVFFFFSSCSIDELFGGKDPLIGEWEFNYDDWQCGSIVVSKNGEIVITSNKCDNSGGGQIIVSNGDGTSTITETEPNPDVINNGSWINDSENANFDDSTQYYEWQFDELPGGDPLDYDLYLFGYLGYLKIDFQNDFNSANLYSKNNPDDEWRSDNYWVLTKIE